MTGAVVIGALWYLHEDPHPSSTILPETPLPVAAPPAAREPLPALIVDTPVPDPPAPSPAPAPTTNEPETPLAHLEQRFHNSRDKEARIEVAAEIAGRSDAAAVAALGRLFQAERHPAVKVALLADLNDISHDTAPEQRLRMLTAALRGQPRDVRTTALDVLAQLDDPQVAPLLKQAMTSDPDHEVREIAAAIFHARFPPDP